MARPTDWRSPVTVAGDNLRNLIAEAIRNAECEQQPKCVWCMTMSVLAELDRAGMVVVSTEDVKGAIEVLEAVNNPWASLSEEPELEARLRAALPEATTDA